MGKGLLTPCVFENTTKTPRHGEPFSILLETTINVNIDGHRIFDNGILEFLDGELTIQKPRENFDVNGRFKPPQKKHLNEIKLTSKEYYDQSLTDSISYFLNFVKNNSVIPSDEQLLSILNTKLLLESQ